jgi:uracil-DNA glycosylase family 4
LTLSFGRTVRDTPGCIIAVARTRQHQLDILQREVRACARCVESGHLPEAHPVVWGPVAGRNMVIGQAPAQCAHLADRPWSGPSGTLMRSWFAKAGLDPERFHDDWYFTSLTKCFPGKAPSGNGDRAPTAAERALCRSYLDTELRLVRPPLIVTLGRQAAEAIVPGARTLKLRDLVGTTWRVDLGHGEVPVVPLPHPSGVARWLNDPAKRALVDRAMAELAAMRAGARATSANGHR